MADSLAVTDYRFLEPYRTDTIHGNLPNWPYGSQPVWEANSIGAGWVPPVFLDTSTMGMFDAFNGGYNYSQGGYQNDGMFGGYPSYSAQGGYNQGYGTSTYPIRKKDETDQEYEDRVAAWEDRQIERQEAREEAQIERQMNRKKRIEGLNLDNESLERQMKILQNCAVNDEQDELIVQYRKALDMISKDLEKSKVVIQKKDETATAYQARLKDAAKTRLESAYSEVTQSDLIQDIEANCDSSFWQGIKDVFQLGMSDDRLASDNIHEIQGTKQQRKNELGRIAGIMLTGAGLIFGLFKATRVITTKVKTARA